VLSFGPRRRRYPGALAAASPERGMLRVSTYAVSAARSRKAARQKRRPVADLPGILSLGSGKSSSNGGPAISGVAASSGPPRLFADPRDPPSPQCSHPRLRSPGPLRRRRVVDHGARDAQLVGDRGRSGAGGAFGRLRRAAGGCDPGGHRRPLRIDRSARLVLGPVARAQHPAHLDDVEAEPAPDPVAGQRPLRAMR